VTGLSTWRSKTAPFHPNAAGMQGITDIIIAQLETVDAPANQREPE
jgi:hypothetical protein